jgi:hypothetical protein
LEAAHLSQFLFLVKWARLRLVVQILLLQVLANEKHREVNNAATWTPRRKRPQRVSQSEFSGAALFVKVAAGL